MKLLKEFFSFLALYLKSDQVILSVEKVWTHRVTKSWDGDVSVMINIKIICCSCADTYSIAYMLD